MPPGSRLKTLRSSDSSAPIEIFVAFAMFLREMPLRSRAKRSVLPKSPMRAVTLVTPSRPVNVISAERRTEKADTGDAMGSGRPDGRHGGLRDPPDRDDWHVRRGCQTRETIEAQRRTSGFG